MMRMMNAFTTELDEIDDAVEDILSQIDLKSLGKNTVGIVTFYSEFIDTGVIKALSEKAPFEIVGMTTMASCCQGTLGMYRLNLSVLTGDDVQFTTALSVPISPENLDEAPLAAFKDALGRASADPVFIITFFPYLQDVGASDLLKSFDKASGGIPVWGSVCSDVDLGYAGSNIVFNGNAAKQSMAMILISGAVEPEFVITALPDRNIDNRRAAITEASGCVIKKANGMTMKDYLSRIGFETREGMDAATVPLLVDYNDGSKPTALAIYSINPDGSALLGGKAPLNGSFSIGEIDYDGIIETARESMVRLLSRDKKGGLLMFSCVTRYLMLAPKSDDEIKLVMEMTGDKIPYTMFYSGGEICPIKDRDGKLCNRFHNFTFAACIF